LVASLGTWTKPVLLRSPVCTDPTDDKFFACALAVEGAMIVSGDQHLLKKDGYQKIAVLSPRRFVDRYLAQ